MSTAIVPDALLSPRALTRWRRATHHTTAAALEGAVYARLGGFKPGTVTEEIEDAIAEHIKAEETCALFVVGTLLMHEGLPDLWKRIYAAVISDPVGPDEHQTFLAENTDKARRGEI
jgi:hypothetical protein